VTDQLLFEVKDHIATITLNRPEKLNAFTNEMLDAWLAAYEECRVRDDVRVVVLTGAGRGFCSGGDVSKMGDQSRDNSPIATKSQLWDHIQLIPKKLHELDKPVIAALNGVATGAGLDMALMCDLRTAAESARFAETYLRVGLVPGDGGSYFLPRLVGAAKALEMFLTADFVDAKEAHRIGLVNHVWPDGELMDRTYELAGRITKMPPISVRLTKRALYQGLNTDMHTALDLISSHMTIARAAEDHVEAIAAFREKRDPVFKGK
jgi:2-(1,2-epoxy-1,2-dihydrophenyl)acetyl-CoA isomerase